jgi:hypothetical protein
MNNQIINWANRVAKKSSADVALLRLNQRSMLLQSMTRFITLGFLGDEPVDFYGDVAVRQGVHERIASGVRKQRKNAVAKWSL